MSQSITIFYRHMPRRAEERSRDPNKKRPSWFSYEICWRNLLSTIQNDPLGELVRIVLLFDGTQLEFIDDFSSKYINNANPNITVQPIIAGSDKNSASIVFNEIYHSNPSGGDIFYTLENDYMHLPGWVTKVFELFDSSIKFDYISLYDHGDKYFLEMYANLTAQIFHTKSLHWRSSPSTCGSFLAKGSTFKSDYDIFCRSLQDFFLFDNLVNQRGRLLLTPMPGLATHCMEGYLSPTIDWQKYIY